MATHTTALVWFRRDLRLRDSPALAYALANAQRVIPVYVFAPHEEGDWAPGAASRWWLHHSLAALDRDLRTRGSRLILRQGDSLAGLRELATQTGATLLTFNRLYEPATLARDRALVDALSAWLEAATFNANLLFEPGAIRNGAGEPYRVFTAFWRNAQARLDELPALTAAPKTLRSPSRWPRSHKLDDLALLPQIAWDAGLADRWIPGENGATAALDRFMRVIADYDSARNRPDLVGSSRFSPHLHFGEISPGRLVHRLQGRSGTGADTFRRELGWREFAHQLLHAFPATPTRPLDPRFERMPWSRRKATLRAWQRGATGYPIVDAGLRELWTTGWMHNRVRMIVASFLTKNLQHHWLEGARWFWDTLVDADLANNTLGWQWTAGCGADASPYYRIFNPVLQAERFDPQRSYIRRWVPEIAQLPDRWIHRPWEATASVLEKAGIRLGATYPKPIVDLRRTRNEAMRAYSRIQVRQD